MHLPSDLLISISGLRGLTAGSLTPEVAYQFTKAFAQTSPPGKIVISRDSRPSGKILRQAVLQGLMSAGREIIDIDLSPLPTTQIAIEECNAAGGIDITASHNPAQYNGLKFLGADGIFIDQNQWDTMRAIVEKSTEKFPEATSEVPIQDWQNRAHTAHIERISAHIQSGKNDSCTRRS